MISPLNTRSTGAEDAGIASTLWDKIRILKSFRFKKGLKTFLFFRPQFFKTSRPSKAKTKTAFAKTRTSENGLNAGLKTKTGLKDYITDWFY